MGLPGEGTFVVLSIDPVASLESLEDDEVNAACRRMKNQKYVAYVADVRCIRKIILLLYPNSPLLLVGPGL